MIPYLDMAHIIEPELNVRAKPLFFRERTLDLIKFLTVTKQAKSSKQVELIKQDELKGKGGVIVEGAPGTGKSCATWAWVLQQIAPAESESVAQASTSTLITGNTASLQVKVKVQHSLYFTYKHVSLKSILWIHLLKSTCYCVRMTCNDVRESILNMEYDSDYLQAKSLVNTATDDIIVLDGLFGCLEKHKSLAFLLEDNKSCFHVQVSSLAFVGHSSLYRALRVQGIKIYEVYPWSLDDYNVACSNQVFFNSVRRFLVDHDDNDEDPARVYTEAEKKELVRRKYYFAGVCARWMFAITFDQIQDIVHDMLRIIASSSVHSLLITGDKAKQSTNGLVVRHEPNKPLFYVSEYVALSLAQICSLEILNTLYETAHHLDNPTFRGWVFEMNVIHSCMKGSLNLFDITGNPLEIACSKLITVTASKEHGSSSLTKGNVLSFDCPIKQPEELINKFMKPREWNNAGFDLTRLDKLNQEWHSIFYQITISKDHKFEMKYFLEHNQKLAAHFGIMIPRVSICMIVPTERDTNLPIHKEISFARVQFVNSMEDYLVGDSSHAWSKRNPQNLIKIYGFKRIPITALVWTMSQLASLRICKLKITRA